MGSGKHTPSTRADVHVRTIRGLTTRERARQLRLIKGGNKEPATLPRSPADDAARDLRRLLVCLLIDDSGYKASDVADLAGVSMAQVRADLRIGRAIRAKALRWR